MRAAIGLAAAALLLCRATAVGGGRQEVFAIPGGPAIPPAGLQSALDKARPGDTLILRAGVTYTGPFRLPRKSGEGTIEIRSSAVNLLPPTGDRVNPSMARFMPKLVSASDPVITAESGAHNYRFVGIEIAPSPGKFLFNLVDLGSSEASVSDVPSHLVFERCYVHGDPRLGSRRGIALNSASTTVRDSY